MTTGLESFTTLNLNFLWEKELHLKKRDFDKNPNPTAFTYLIRSDLHKSVSVFNDYKDSHFNKINAWWVERGCYEYFAWSRYILETQYGPRLLDPLPGWSSWGQFGMSPFLLHLIKNRPDLSQSFDVQTPEGLWHANAWLYVHGLNEHQGMDLVDGRVMRALNQTPPFFRSRGSSHSVAPTWLMFFLWRVSGELQAEYDLRDSSRWDDYIAWFLVEGVDAFRLSTLMSSRWKAKVRQFSREGGGSEVVPINLKWAFSDKRLGSRRDGHKKRPFGVNLIGFAFGELGIGEDIRMAAEACEEAGIPVAIVNISPGSDVRQKDMALLKYLEKGDVEEAPYAINIFCLTAFDTARVYLEKGLQLFKGRYNIGWWPWELPVWPKRWGLVFDLVDEVWGSSTFATEMYQSAVNEAGRKTVVKKVPLRVSIERLKPMSRAQLGLPEDWFLFLYVFDSNSYLSRKNPLGALRAFQNAFPRGSKKVGMVFKTMNPKKNSPEYQAFKKACMSDRRVILIENTMDRGEVLGLMQACDAYISLHRAEGFGRTIAEALMLGKPTIATDFSGNTDFEGYIPVPWKKRRLKAGEYPFVQKEDHAWWADPSEDIASCFKQAMEMVRDKPGSPSVSPRSKSQRPSVAA